MKFLKGIFFGLLAALVVSVPAFAQTYATVKAGTSGNFVHREAAYTSASTPAWDNVANTSANYSLVLQSTSSSIPVVTNFALSDGSIVTSRTDTITTAPTVISTSGPLNFQKVRVSPTVSMSTHTLSIDSVSTK